MYSQQKKGKVVLIIVASAAVLIAAGLTIGILYLVNKPAKSSENNNTEAPLSSAVIVEAFQKTPPAALVDFQPHQLTASDADVSVKQDGAAYGVSLQSEAAVLFSGPATAQKPSTDVVLSESEAVFKRLGLEKRVTYPSGVTYGDKALVCQLDIQSEPVFVTTIACVKNEAVTAAYQSIEKLVALYNQKAADADKIKDPLQISQTILERDGVSGVILSVQYSENAKAGSYLFGALNGQWEYVTNLTGGVSTGKSNIPESALPLIKDAKWKDVLTELTGVGQ